MKARKLNPCDPFPFPLKRFCVDRPQFFRLNPPPPPPPPPRIKWPQKITQYNSSTYIVLPFPSNLKRWEIDKALHAHSAGSSFVLYLTFWVLFT